MALCRPDFVFKEPSLTERARASAAAFRQLQVVASGWLRHVDEESGREYWHNSRTGRSSWEPPDPAAESTTSKGPAAVAAVDPTLARFSLECLQKQLLQRDYVSMRCDYDRQRPYRCVTGQYDDIEVLSTKELCVLCRTKPVDMVVFPCQHACLCADCVTKGNIGPEFAPPNPKDRAWSSCPLCAESIKKVCPLTRDEVVAYWKWAYDVRPKLPSNFAKHFVDGRVLAKKQTKRPP